MKLGDARPEFMCVQKVWTCDATFLSLSTRVKEPWIKVSPWQYGTSENITFYNRKENWFNIQRASWMLYWANCATRVGLTTRRKYTPNCDLITCYCNIPGILTSVVRKYWTSKANRWILEFRLYKLARNRCMARRKSFISSGTITNPGDWH